MYCSTALPSCQGLFSVIYREVLSQSQKIRGVYWTIILLCYSCKSKKGGQPDVYSDWYCFYMGNETDLSVDENSVANRASSNRNNSVGVWPSFILNKFSIFSIDKYLFVY